MKNNLFRKGLVIGILFLFLVIGLVPSISAIVNNEVKENLSKSTSQSLWPPSRRSFVVGDHPHDIQLARNICARGIYVLTGHGRKHVDELPEDSEIVSGIMEAAEKILFYHLSITSGNLWRKRLYDRKRKNFDSA